LPLKVRSWLLPGGKRKTKSALGNRGKKWREIMFLAFFAISLIVVAGVWLYVIAFRTSKHWFIASLLLPPLGVFFFGIVHFRICKRPLLLYIISFLILGTFFVNAILQAPSGTKTILVDVLWTPKYPDFMKNEPSYRSEIHGKDQIVYRVYYAWNTEKDKLPWWIITNSIDGKWRVIEAANSDNYNTESSENETFNKEWAHDSFKNVSRTGREMIRHALFGTDDFSQEREALQKVLKLINVQREFEIQGKDLFDSMKNYLSEHPDIATFFPDDRTYFDKQFKDMEGLYLKEKEVVIEK